MWKLNVMKPSSQHLNPEIKVSLSQRAERDQGHPGGSHEKSQCQLWKTSQKREASNPTMRKVQTNGTLYRAAASDLPDRRPQESWAKAEGLLHTEGCLTLTQIPVHQDHQLDSAGSGTGSADEEAVVYQCKLPGFDCAYLRSVLWWLD